MEASLHAGAYDAACFHAQQAAEKYLKAFLTHHDRDFPYTHNLTRLAELCATVDDSFRSLMPQLASLTPYAVQLRYDAEFWPIRQVAEEAGATALSVRDFVLRRSPESRRWPLWTKPRKPCSQVRVLLDECVPTQVKSELIGHDGRTVGRMGWAVNGVNLKKGRLVGGKVTYVHRRLWPGA